MFGPFTLILIYDAINALHLVNGEFYVFVGVHCWDIGGDVGHSCGLFGHLHIILDGLHDVLLLYLNDVVWVSDHLYVLKIV